MGSLPTNKCIYYYCIIASALEMGLKSLGDFKLASDLEQNLTKMWK